MSKKNWMKVELPKILIPGSRSSFRVHSNNTAEQSHIWELEI